MRKPSDLAVRPVRSEADLTAALREIEGLMSAPPGSAGADRLEVLSTLVAAYEARHHAIAPPDPVDAIRFRLEQQGLTSKALEGLIGTRARVFEVMNRKRPLSIGMIRRLHKAMHIPLESLVGGG